MGNTVLIVEANQIIAELIAEHLREQLGMDSVITSNKADTIRELKDSNRFFLAIVANESDDSSPEELIHIVHRNALTTIILMSGSAHLLSELIDMRYVVETAWKNRRSDITSIVKTVENVSNNRNVKVLVVDGSAVVRMLLRSQLEAQLFTVLEASDGEEAMRIVAKKGVSLILTEYKMDKMDGLELIRLIREKYSREELGVIVVSAENDSEVITNLLRQGANDFIEKPWVHEVLDCRINNTVRAIEMHRKMYNLANRDYLTEHYNRRFFFAELDRVGKSDTQFVSVAMMDLDKFKSVNDTYGHDIGDQVLRQFADLLRRGLGAHGTVGRIGGEEFAILFVNHKLVLVLALLEQVRAAVEKEVVTLPDGATLHFTVSTGVASEVSASPRSLLKKADELLYEAKETGRNKIVP